MSEQYSMPLIAVVGLDIGTRTLAARFVARRRGCPDVLSFQKPQSSRDESIIHMILDVTTDVKSRLSSGVCW